MNFASTDALIESVMDFQMNGIIDIPYMLGPRFDTVNMFYSSPEYYTECKYKEMQASRQMHHRRDEEGEGIFASEQIETSPPIGKQAAAVKMSVKTDDFFPYSDCEHCFWTGYFSSRASLKRFERVASSFLLSTRQIESMLDVTSAEEKDSATCEARFHDLEDGLGVLQHHDGVSGTSKQHVAYDYAQRVQQGINSVTPCTLKKLKRLFLGVQASDNHWTDLSFCQLLNETICEVAQVRRVVQQFHMGSRRQKGLSIMLLCFVYVVPCI
jgi:hypothetical protein